MASDAREDDNLTFDLMRHDDNSISNTAFREHSLFCTRHGRSPTSNELRQLIGLLTGANAPGAVEPNDMPREPEASTHSSIIMVQPALRTTIM